MVDVSITPGSVVKGSDATVAQGIAGVTILAGQVVSRDSDGTIKLCDADSATASLRVPIGIALNGGSIGQPISFQTAGSITVGGTLVTGTVYLSSDGPGGLRPAVDLNSGDFTAVMGIASSAAILKMGIVFGGSAF
jgi:hypothetical protein